MDRETQQRLNKLNNSLYEYELKEDRAYHELAILKDDVRQKEQHIQGLKYHKNLIERQVNEIKEGEDK